MISLGAAGTLAQMNYDVFEDFTSCEISGSTLRTPTGTWTLSGVGSPTMTQQPSNADQPGILRYHSTGVSDTAILVYNATLPQSQQIRFVDFSLRFVSNTPTNQSLWAGLSAVPAVGMGSVQAAVWAESANPGKTWESVRAQGGTSKVDMGIFRNTTAWKRSQILAPSAGPSATLLITDGTGKPHSSNLPSSGSALFLLSR